MGNCRSTVIPPLINPVTNDIVVNESDKANVLNNYFCFISSTANNIDPPNLPRRTPFSLDVDDINDDDVIDILKSLQMVKHQAEIWGPTYNPTVDSPMVRQSDSPTNSLFL